MIPLQSLRMRVGLLLALTFAPLFGLTVYWSYLEQANRLAEMEASELRLVRQVAATYGQIIQRTREVLMALVEFPAVRERDATACSALFAELLPHYPQYLNLGVADTDGNLFCSGYPFAHPVNVRDMAAFGRVVETRAFAVGDYDANRRGTGLPFVGVAYPVIDGRGGLRAVAATILKVDWLNALAAEFTLPEGTTLTIVDQSGLVVVRQPESEKWVGRDVSNSPLFAARLRGETRFEATSSLDGVKRRFVLAAVDGVPAPAKLSVSVGIDADRALAPLRATLYRNLGFLLGVALAAFAAGWFGTERSVIRRVNALLATTRRLAGGDLGARAVPERGSPNELRQLGQAFDDMAAALQQREQETSAGRKALGEQEALLRTVIETLPVGVWIIGADGKILTANHKAREIWGDVKHAGATDTSQRIATHEWGVARALGTGEHSINEIIDIEVLDGTRKTIAYWAVPLRDAEGRITGAVAVNQDITERKRAEEAVREWRDRYEAVILASGQLFYDWDARTNIVTYGGNLEQVVGYNATEMAGGIAHWLEIIHPDDLHRFNSELERSVATKTPFHEEYRVRHRDGHLIIVRDDGYPILDAAGELTRVCGVVADITERKRAEEQRLRLEAQLRQAQKMEALGTLAGGIAHDFNNMLGAIIGNVALARQDVGANHQAQESLAEIAKASTRARDLVQQILAFSRQQAQERRVVDLREVIEESVKLLRATLPAGIELTTTSASDAPNVLADPTQIQQVLMNLCMNAWQAIEGAVGRIEITLADAQVRSDQARVDLQPGRYACLSVIDSGKGMDQVTVERIFDPFFTTKALGEGTGLGLAVVDGIVKNHDGAIAVDSVPGQGSAFHLYFPAVEAEAETPRGAPASLPRGDGQRILYLDDEEALVLLATRLLGRLGYEVRGFTSGAEALAAFHADPGGFDLFVTDLNMPGASGLDIAAEMLRQRPDLPVALASGYVTEALRAQARALGIREVLYKPNTVDELVAAIGRLLTGLERAVRQAG